MAHSNGSSAHGSTSPPNDHVASFWTRYEHLKLNDVMKNVLLEDVISRYDHLVQKHAEYVKQHEAERERAQTSLQREQQLQTSIAHLQRLLNRDPFILVLVDGDGMIFNSNFLREGEAGGRQAATHLHSAVQKWAAENVVDCPEDVSVVIRVYANLKGLAEACTKAGVITSPNQLEEFSRGFTRGNHLCDFVDVGYGKDRADAKVAETFKLFVYNYYCRQILFGCSHDNGFARLLEQYATDEEALLRVTLLEGVPFEKELAVLPFPTKKFAGVFRETKISLPGNMDLLTGTVLFRNRTDSGTLNATSGIFTPRINSPFSATYNMNVDGMPLAQRLPHLRSTSITSSGASSDAGVVSNTWASIANKSAALPFADLQRTTSAVVEPVKTIQRNRAGQRIDEPLEYEREEVQRLKRMKMCNQHYLGINGCCHYKAGKEDKCPHRHDYKMTSKELYCLRVVARETPCKKGFECDDENCIYGHRCPFPTATEGSSRGSGMCLNGENCRFPRNMHGVDTKIVKTLRVTGAF